MSKVGNNIVQRRVLKRNPQYKQKSRTLPKQRAEIRKKTMLRNQ
jgi:hypothetical protein